MADVAHVNQADVLQAIRNRICEQLPHFFSDVNVYVDDQPLPSNDRVPDFMHCISVCPSDGNFEGNAPCDIREAFGIDVTVMKRDPIDQPGRLDVAFVDDEHGLIRFFKPALMTALLIDQDPTTGSRRRWMPTTADGLEMLAEDLKIVGFTSPKRVESWPMLAMTLHLNTTILWAI